MDNQAPTDFDEQRTVKPELHFFRFGEEQPVSLDVETEINDISILHDIFVSMKTEKTFLF